MACRDCDDTGCPECKGGADECERCDGDGCSQCDPEYDPSPLCNCGTCTPPHFTCIRED
jgi:hypothetical protein